MGEATGNDKKWPRLTRMELADHGVDLDLDLDLTARGAKLRSVTVGTVYSITARVRTVP